ncbi:MAG TPA: SdrD B-like domain-containing protein [Humisphaera sp.]
MRSKGKQTRAAAAANANVPAARLTSRPSARRRKVSLVESLEDRRLMSGSLGGDGGIDPGDVIPPDAYEANESFTAAKYIGTLGETTVAGTVHSSTDVDYYLFTAATTGTVVVSLDFAGSEGNLDLAAYNAGRALVAQSVTTTGGHEALAVSVTAGQAYYLKVYGAGGATSTGYGLHVGQASAGFTWAMQDRLGNAQWGRDEFGLPIIFNTPDYVRPSPGSINGTSFESTFAVTFDGGASVVGSAAPTYSWHVTGNTFGGSVDFASASPTWTTNLPEGKYTVTLTASGGGVSVSQTQTVKVVDHLVVVMGDSYISGEGNPNSPRQYDDFGFVKRETRWAAGGNQAETDWNAYAHRSSNSGAVQAALQLERSDPHSSVTLVFVAQSGATIERGILGGYNGAGAVQGVGYDVPQIDKVKALVGTRHVDSLTVSVGGNDAGVADVLGDLVNAVPGWNGYSADLQAAWDRFATRLKGLEDYWYPELGKQLKQKLGDVGQVYLTEYPDPTRGPGGAVLDKVLDDVVPFHEVDQQELNLAIQKVLVPLATAMHKAAAKQGWTLVDGIASKFAEGHGYGSFSGSWFVTADQSTISQGPRWNRNVAPSLDDLMKTTGKAHPNAQGQLVYRDAIYAAWTKADLVTTSFTLPATAFTQAGNNTFSITVRNQGMVASAPATTGALFLSDDDKLDPSYIDLACGSFSIPALGPGEEVTVTGTVTPRSDPFQSDNDYYVIPVLDAGQAAAESDEVNNAVPNNTRFGQNLGRLRAENDLVSLGIASSGSPFIRIGDTVAAGLGTDEFIGGRDVDVYVLSASAGQTFDFDVDTPAGSPVNAAVRLYRQAAAPGGLTWQVAWNDNAAAPGEAAGNDPYLRHTFDQTGLYLLVVSSAANLSADPGQLDGRADGPTGAYTLSMTQFLLPPPTVGAVAPAQAWVTAGSPLGLYATGVAAGSASTTVAEVRFYRETNAVDGWQPSYNLGDGDLFLGSDANGADGWSVTASTAGLEPGGYTYYAVAVDNQGRLSPAVSTASVVIPPPPPNVAPAVGGLTATPSTAVVGTPVTLTATGVSDPDGTVAGVAFYRETNSTPGLQLGAGGDTLVYADANGTDGWSAGSATAALPAGQYTFYAQATDNLSARSNVATATVTVTDPPPNVPPTVGGLTASPTSVQAGTPVTLTATGVGDADGAVAFVAFFRESNGTPGLQVGAGGDEAVGTDVSSAGGWTISAPTAGLAAGRYQFYAGAQDNAGAPSNVATAFVDVTAAPPPVQTGGVFGAVFNDANADGVRQGTELPMAGVKLYLDANNNNYPDANEPTAVTATNGSFTFANVPVGLYRLREVVPAGYRQSLPLTGYQDLAVVAGQTTGTVTFGNTTRSRITGVVYNDANGDGARQSTEPGIAGRTVWIDKNNNNVRDAGELSATTDATGTYAFDNLPAGNYVVRQVVPLGSRATGNNWNLFVGTAQVSANRNFGTTTNVKIAGTVFNDANGDRVRQSTEAALAGWKVYADLNNSGTLDAGDVVTTTDLRGNYAFNALAAGTYAVRVAPPTFAWKTTTPVGGAFSVTLASGKTVSGKVFGEKLIA